MHILDEKLSSDFFTHDNNQFKLSLQIHTRVIKNDKKYVI